MILYSGTTGPLALWTIAAGTALSFFGFIASSVAADTEIDQMLQFCAFGEQAGRPALSTGWSLCKKSFAEWNPATQEGLLLQLRAFQQIYYSFTASGAESVEPGPLASDGILRISPSSLRHGTSFKIGYKAVYVPLGVELKNPAAPPAGAKTLEGTATVVISGGLFPWFEDPSGNYETATAIRLHQDAGANALDIRFRLIKEFLDRSGTPLELGSLVCQVQLLVPAANIDDQGKEGGDLIVPTTAAGPQTLKVEAVVKRLPNDKVEATTQVK
jgi:hypothetical protein